MPDVMTPEQRSRCMSRIRATKTKPEMRLRKALWTQGLRYRVNRKLPGKPDLVFVGARLAVFVDGCFWHGCPIHGKSPKSNQSYWTPKIARNRERDVIVSAALQSAGWTVLRFWEHEIEADLGGVVETIAVAKSKATFPPLAVSH
ncbi:very short patch repair endonuclease [Rhizobium laguerreae]|nr:very short patch repair endonuclease [Rhizobium laguerreae]